MRYALIACMTLAAAFGANADSLFDKEAEDQGGLISNKKVDFEEGDIVTVLVQEVIDATTESNTNTKKESSTESEALSAANPFLTATKPAGGLGLIEQEKLPNWALELENEHRTTGQTKRKNRLTTTVSCMVTKVHDNGNIEIEGEKQVTVNREDSRIYVKGVARGKDVTASNAIRSDQLANCIVELRGRGPLWNNQRRGLITKILDWFSPF
ncbi:MAG: flagellar basal body L-ring protein FlgH [bacterium]|nr:flagellar basal body L-ring protein FlgH [bacterium]